MKEIRDKFALRKDELNTNRLNRLSFYNLSRVLTKTFSSVAQKSMTYSPQISINPPPGSLATDRNQLTFASASRMTLPDRSVTISFHQLTETSRRTKYDENRTKLDFIPLT